MPYFLFYGITKSTNSHNYQVRKQTVLLIEVLLKLLNSLFDLSGPNQLNIFLHCPIWSIFLHDSMTSSFNDVVIYFQRWLAQLCFQLITASKLNRFEET